MKDNPTQYAFQARCRFTPYLFLALLLVGAGLLGACQPVVGTPPASSDSGQVDAADAGTESVPLAQGSLVVYSGRNENLVGPLIERFQEETGITVEVRYGGTAELAATILEEGSNSPADVFYGQDAGALGALAKRERLVVLPAEILDRVDARFRAGDGRWVGTSGRARVFVYNTNELSVEELPDDVWGLTEPRWQGKVGWAPTNGSFQGFVTALRVLEGEERAREWLAAMIANGTQPYPSNTVIVEATARGEVLVGLVNHYYLYRFLAESGESFAARNYHPLGGGAGTMINVAGAGILDTSQDQANARQFVAYLLSEEAQRFFAAETTEYPLIDGIEIDPMLEPLDAIHTPVLDLSDLDDLEGTLQLLQEVGALE